MRLKYQIFLTLLAASAFLIAIMFAFSSWSFSRGFLDYVRQNEINRLAPIAEELVFEFERSGNWDTVNEELVRYLRRRNAPGRDADERADIADENGEKKRSESSALGAKGRSKRRPPPPPLIVTDADRNVLIGKLKPNATMQWINLETDDQIIGYLGFPNDARVDRQFDRLFEEKQKKTFLWTALAMVLLSALLSIPLASRIVRPLLNVNKAVDEISGGNYAHRIDSSRRDELGDLATNINTLGTTLEQNRDARQRWIAEISHELRTPLAVMRGELEAVQDGVRKLDQSAVDSLHSETLSLGRLVDDLHTLSMSDVGALNYQMETLDLTTLLDDFLTSSQAVLKQHDISLSTDIKVLNAPIQGDVQRLEQLLCNLLQNTCRYTDEGGQLNIALQHSRNDIDAGSDSDNSGVNMSTGLSKRQSLCIIDWYDSSPGVATDVLPKLFEPLFRTDLSRNRELGGSGLGLSIAKRIVEAHNGTITASESSLGGLHIKISLPMSIRNV